MRVFEKTKRFLKKGIVGVEYCVIGAIIILGALTTYRIATSNTDKHMESGARDMGDDPGVIFTENTGKGYMITGLDVIPGDISLKLGETKKLTTIIAPSNVWNYQLAWNISAADSTVARVEPTNGSIEANVTGLTEGKALIQVKTTDGSDLSKDVIVRVGYPITEFTVTGTRVFQSSEVGVLQIEFDDDNVSWANKSVELTLRNETEFGGEGVATSGTPKLQTKVADFVMNSTGKIVVYPNQGGTIRFDVTVRDHTFETSYTETVDLSIQSYYYRYRDLKDWTGWSDTYVEGAYNEEKTQYGYQTVAIWNNEWLTAKPADGYYNSRTQYGYQDVATWKNEWLTSQPSDGYYNKRTQYGYRDVTAWATTYQTTKPSSAFFDTRVEAVTKTKSGSNEGGVSAIATKKFKDVAAGAVIQFSHGVLIDVGTTATGGTIKASLSGCSGCNPSYDHPGKRNVGIYATNNASVYQNNNATSGWTKLDAKVGSAGSVSTNAAGYRYFLISYSDGCWNSASYNYSIQYSANETHYYLPKSWSNWTWSTSATSAFTQTNTRQIDERTTYQSPSTWGNEVWSTTATSAYVKTASRKPLSKTTYQRPATWNAATGWRDNTPYTKNYTTKPVEKKLYRYREYGAWSNWFLCDTSGCPESTSTRQVETRNGSPD